MWIGTWLRLTKCEKIQLRNPSHFIEDVIATGATLTVVANISANFLSGERGTDSRTILKSRISCHSPISGPITQLPLGSFAGTMGERERVVYALDGIPSLHCLCLLHSVNVLLHSVNVYCILSMSIAFCQCLLHSVNVYCILSMSAAFCRCLLHSVYVYYILSMSTAFCQCLLHSVNAYGILSMSTAFCQCLVHSVNV